eukprot:gene12654-2314_t
MDDIFSKLAAQERSSKTGAPPKQNPKKSTPAKPLDKVYLVPQQMRDTARKRLEQGLLKSVEKGMSVSSLSQSIEQSLYQLLAADSRAYREQLQTVLDGVVSVIGREVVSGKVSPAELAGMALDDMKDMLEEGLRKEVIITDPLEVYCSDCNRVITMSLCNANVAGVRDQEKGWVEDAVDLSLGVCDCDSKKTKRDTDKDNDSDP